MKVIDTFLTTTYALSEDMSAGIGPQLAVLPSPNSTSHHAQVSAELTPDDATTPGTAASLLPSPFFGMSPEQVAAQLGEPTNEYFEVLYARAVEDGTVLLCARETDDEGEFTGRLLTVRGGAEMGSGDAYCC